VAKHIHLRKANDDLVSHCKCDKADALISAPGQMDCPWCGCGWLFICNRCRKAFTFAEGVRVDESWTEIGKRSLRGFYGREPEPKEIDEWVGFMKFLHKGVRTGGKYVYFDGYVVPATAEGIAVEGSHARHDLDYVPQVAALTDPEIMNDLLCSHEYWQSNRIEREESEQGGSSESSSADPPCARMVGRRSKTR
jgi:hypothetical protein